jgi:hypothetical protein
LAYDAERDGKINGKMVEAWKWAQGFNDDMYDLGIERLHRAILLIVHSAGACFRYLEIH